MMTPLHQFTTAIMETTRERMIYRQWLAHKLTNMQAVEALNSAGHADAASIVSEWIAEWAAIEEDHHREAMR